MKKVSLSLFMACVLSLFGCTSDINSDIPVSSNDLIDQNVVYKSETIKVDVEEAPAPTNSFSKKENKKEEVKPVNKEAEKAKNDEIKIIIPPTATSDETINFTETSYIEKTPTDIEFEQAVSQAEVRRGITPSKVAKPVSNKPTIPVKKDNESKTTQAKRKLEVKDVEPKRSVTFLSTVIYHSNTKADISPRDMKALKNVAKLAREKNAIVRVVGNASSRSKDMKEVQNKVENFDLSLLRAQNVSKALIGYGVPKDKIFISAVADTEKIVEENMPINEAINRRTEIYLNY